MSQTPALGQSPAPLISQAIFLPPPAVVSPCILAWSCWSMVLQSVNWSPLLKSSHLSSSSQPGKVRSVWGSTLRSSKDERGLRTLTPNPHLPTQPLGPFFSASQRPPSCTYFSLGNLWRQSKFAPPTPCLGPQADNTGSVFFLKSSFFHGLNFTTYQLRTSKQVSEELSTLQIKFSEGFGSEL